MLRQRRRSMHIKVWVCVPILIAFILPGSALAGEYSRFGPYIGISGVYAYPLFEDQLQDINPALSVNGSGGLNARLGLRLLSFLAIEAQYEWVDGFKIDLSGVGHIATFSANNIAANLRFHIPVWRVDPYILAGLGASFWKIENGSASPIDFSNDGAGFVGRLGGGLDLYLTKHIALNAEVTVALTTREFEVPSTLQGIDNLFYLSASAGLVYRF